MGRVPAPARWPIAYALAQMAPPSDTCCEALESALDAPDSDIRWAIVVLLARLGRAPSSPIASRLVALLKSGSATQRRMAVYALRDIAPSDAQSQRAVRDALGDADPLVRVAALTSLKTFPEVGRAAVGDILNLLEHDPDTRVRATAALAVANTGQDSANTRAALARASQDASATIAKAARLAVEMMGRKS
jgi:HEAT repeat protein